MFDASVARVSLGRRGRRVPSRSDAAPRSCATRSGPPLARTTLALVATVLVAVVLLPACDPPPANPTTAAMDAVPARFAHRDGQQLLDGDGRPIRINGMNLGGWLNWESYLFSYGAPYENESTMMANLAGVVGTERAEQFREEVRDNFIGRDDFVAMRNRGVNTVRVPINHRLLGAGTRQAGWDVLDRTLGWAEASGIYVIIDLHAAPCGQSTMWHADHEGPAFWTDASCRQRTIDLWKAIATRYADRTIVLGYDLLNEPPDVDDATLRAFYRDLTAGIRAVDPNHVLIYEGEKVATDFTFMATIPDPNAMISVHDYDWNPFQGVDVRERTNRSAADRLGVPGVLGEFGLVRDEQSNVAMRAWYTQNPWMGFVQWSWKAMEHSQVPDSRVHTDASRALMRYVTDARRPRPTPAQAEVGMADFIAAVR